MAVRTSGSAGRACLREFDDDGWVEGVAPRAHRRSWPRQGLFAPASTTCRRERASDDLRALVPKATLVLDRRGGRGSRDARRARCCATGPRRLPPCDPTGAGDVFLAALMVAWLLTGSWPRPPALRFAAAAAACAVEGVGLAGVPTGPSWQALAPLARPAG